MWKSLISFNDHWGDIGEITIYQTNLHLHLYKVFTKNFKGEVVIVQTQEVKNPKLH